MSTVFETGVPMFTGIAPADTTERLLSYSTIEFQSEKVQKMFQSPVSSTGHRTWKIQGTAANHARHLTFNVHVELHKFDSNPLTSPFDSAKAAAALLLTYEDTDVYFYPFFNVLNYLGVKNSAGVLVPCHLVEIQFGWKVLAGALLDVCDLTFMTNDFCDISKLVKT
jgi:hypothetical protein